MNRRRFLGTTVPIVTGCIGGSSGGDDDETTTGGGTTTEEGTATERRTTVETTEVATEPARTTDRPDTTAAAPTEDRSGTSTENPYRPPTPMGTPTENGLAIVAIHPTQEQREFISGEYVTLRNTGDDPLDLSRYSLSVSGRSDGPIDTYLLTLEPGATLYALTRSGGDSVLESSPPGYLRYAGYDEPVLNDDSGTVVVSDPNGDPVLEQSYNDDTDTTVANSTNGTEDG